ncbi:hypothetical protein TNCV_1279711 [Trichonephila clavipes]|nr:hypothetical protein TNCV_1279711 [Trichonephila clavipes]
MACEILLRRFYFENEPRLGRPSDVNDKALRKIVRTTPTLTLTEVQFKFGIHQTTTLDYIKRILVLYLNSLFVSHRKIQCTEYRYVLQIMLVTKESRIWTTR